ncbi:MAG: dinitrogenase iron-molybdenum cofactor biosynthesis domain-containing protein [Desulfobacula sp.]|nr:dinitrogenase iron-molybdenum cofactor biosynthesis domain-containing protein [Desulfobacula sp.]
MDNRIAITIWGNRISPVFDVASTLLVADIKNKMIFHKTYLSFDPGIPSDFIKTLQDFKISMVACGAISNKPADLIIKNNIKLISFVTGNALKFLSHFAKEYNIDNYIIDKKFIMPGCIR